ncbi:MAG: YIP1 family protein [Gammaproteobacteria bacterium]|uniref:Inner membrane protein YohC n=1 Tax=Marinobacter litoralis TaxID=187981 RepID=A0A3M2RDD0_9GAMM|nr:Yip1 family protein [Marinobacter litoralis]MBR9871411.1 YIP1 family protein [Gammaproteobacteria bacterium]RMJ03159.1 Inner membrane protein YohC [Marinobacter litoralis]
MLLSHAFGLFTHPGQEWASIRKEHESPMKLYVAYVLALAAIAPICAYISTAHFGWTIGNERLIKLTEISAIQLSVLTYVAMLVGVFALGYAINWMAKTYGAKEEHVPSNGVALAAYSCTPMFLAGFALLYPVPWFNAFVFLAAAAYSAWLMYDGLPIVMGIEKERAVMYGGALLTVALVILVTTRGGSVILWNLGVGPVFISG